MAAIDALRSETDALLRVSELQLRKLAFWHGFSAAMTCVGTASLLASWAVTDTQARVLVLVVVAAGFGMIASVVFFQRAERTLDRTHQRVHQLLKAEAQALLARLEEGT